MLTDDVCYWSTGTEYSHVIGWSKLSGAQRRYLCGVYHVCSSEPTQAKQKPGHSPLLKVTGFSTLSWRLTTQKCPWKRRVFQLHDIFDRYEVDAGFDKGIIKHMCRIGLNRLWQRESRGRGTIDWGSHKAVGQRGSWFNGLRRTGTGRVLTTGSQGAGRPTFQINRSEMRFIAYWVLRAGLLLCSRDSSANFKGGIIFVFMDCFINCITLTTNN